MQSLRKVLETWHELIIVPEHVNIFKLFTICVTVAHGVLDARTHIETRINTVHELFPARVDMKRQFRHIMLQTSSLCFSICLANTGID